MTWYHSTIDKMTTLSSTTNSSSSFSSYSSSSSSMTITNTLPSCPSMITTTTSTHVQQTFSIKLTSKNYIPWKLQFTLLLNFYNLHRILNGTESPPSREIINPTTNESSINTNYNTWFNKDQLLFS